MQLWVWRYLLLPSAVGLTVGWVELKTHTALTLLSLPTSGTKLATKCGTLSPPVSLHSQYLDPACINVCINGECESISCYWKDAARVKVFIFTFNSQGIFLSF